ncbi:unnamed protein product [Ilex paraguariensis]|uniref:Uncharacterized protein n=1 Tax=Ilex paraguariensis TaxID=185542 RepID=A0ABC8S5Q0_9AQUA
MTSNKRARSSKACSTKVKKEKSGDPVPIKDEPVGNCVCTRMDLRRKMGKDTSLYTWQYRRQIHYLLVGRLMSNLTCLSMIMSKTSTLPSNVTFLKMHILYL